MQTMSVVKPLEVQLTFGVHRECHLCFSIAVLTNTGIRPKAVMLANKLKFFSITRKFEIRRDLDIDKGDEQEIVPIYSKLSSKTSRKRLNTNKFGKNEIFKESSLPSTRC
jgi:hypothetical protein